VEQGGKDAGANQRRLAATRRANDDQRAWLPLADAGANVLDDVSNFAVATKEHGAVAGIKGDQAGKDGTLLVPGETASGINRRETGCKACEALLGMAVVRDVVEGLQMR